MKQTTTSRVGSWTHAAYTGKCIRLLTVSVYFCALAHLLTITQIESKSSAAAFPRRFLALEGSRDENHHDTRSRQHVRFTRQAPAGEVRSSSPVGPQAADASSAASTADGSTANGDEPEKEEILSSFKCDFGTADALDLCKFKLLDDENPLIGHGVAANWQTGSGRSALFQGGPLIDSTQGNDTNGGYIFYETSNAAYSNPVVQQAANSQQADHRHHSSGNNNNNNFASHLSVAKLRHKSPANVAPNQFEGTYASLSTYQQFLSSPRLSVQSALAGPTIMSPNLTAPGAAGMCLSFQYAIHGLSADELRVSVLDQKTQRARQIWSATESAAGTNWTKAEVLYSVANKHSMMFTATGSSTPAAPANANSPGTSDIQQRKFRGHIALDDIEINKHDPAATDGPCKGHCNFDGDLCGWTNGENNVDDNFDWSFGRSSNNLFSGPARDFTSSMNNELTGSYLFIDSGYPRRPGDKAQLLSPLFQPTAVNEAMCLRLAVHMFGSGIGTLAIKIRYSDEQAASAPDSGAAGSANSQPAGVAGAAPSVATAGAGAGGGTAPGVASNNQQTGALLRSGGDSAAGKNDLVIWEMSGDSGNHWHQAQTSVSSAKSPFQVLIEGTIGENHLGYIAIDEISFSAGSCPTSPPAASKNYGDCTFEQSMCYWRNPDAEIHLDDLDWIRTSDEQSIHGPNVDHTIKKRQGFFLKLENTLREPKSGSRSFLLSPIFSPKPNSNNVQCLSFYYYMFMRSISASGPNLGTIRVYLATNNELVPIWRLTNPISSPNWKHARASLSIAMLDGESVAPTKLFQIAFEGIWGDAQGGTIALDDISVFDGACDIMPPEARSVPGECTFDVDMCSWTNKTHELLLAPGQTDIDADSSRSPFLQSVGQSTGGAVGSTGANLSGGGTSGSASLTNPTGSGGTNRRVSPTSWQLATVDSRPVNLQDHTYKAPIGYAYVDVLDGGGQQMMFTLQSAEITVQAGQQNLRCLSFWFAAFGRQSNNQLGVFLTQASAPPSDGLTGEVGASGANQPAGRASSTSGLQAMSGIGAGTSVSASDGTSGESSNAWKSINGKLLWSVALKNITESSRRKWLYGQVSIRADSNHIVRLVATSGDGGFALDDLSFFEGSCETRPSHARVLSPEEEEEINNANNQTPASQPAPPK